MSNSKFIRGDKVKCLEASTLYCGVLTEGNEYTVFRSANGFVTVTDDINRTYAEERFKLIDRPNPADSKPISNGPRLMTLPVDSKERKNYPLFMGCVRYFPAALAGVANVSKLGNDKHNPGQELHHDRAKSMDHADCIIRHLVDTSDLLAALGRGDEQVSTQNILTEISQAAWRVLALSQELHEQFGSPLAPGAKK